MKVEGNKSNWGADFDEDTHEKTKVLLGKTTNYKREEQMQMKHKEEKKLSISYRTRKGMGEMPGKPC